MPRLAKTVRRRSRELRKRPTGQVRLCSGANARTSSEERADPVQMCGFVPERNSDAPEVGVSTLLLARIAATDVMHAVGSLEMP